MTDPNSGGGAAGGGSPPDDSLDLTHPEVDKPKVEPALATRNLAVGTKNYSFNERQHREETRGDLARGLLWLLTFAIGGVLVFIGLGLLDGSVLTQSIFPSLIALAGTALGFYFGSQTVAAQGNPATDGSDVTEQ